MLLERARAVPCSVRMVAGQRSLADSTRRMGFRQQQRMHGQMPSQPRRSQGSAQRFVFLTRNPKSEVASLLRVLPASAKARSETSATGSASRARCTRSDRASPHSAKNRYAIYRLRCAAVFANGLAKLARGVTACQPDRESWGKPYSKGFLAKREIPWAREREAGLLDEPIVNTPQLNRLASGRYPCCYKTTSARDREAVGAAAESEAAGLRRFVFLARECSRSFGCKCSAST